MSNSILKNISSLVKEKQRKRGTSSSLLDDKEMKAETSSM